MSRVTKLVVPGLLVILSLCVLVLLSLNTTLSSAGPNNVGFSLVYQNTFDAPLGKEWTRYGGVPGCCPSSLWVKDQAVVSLGELQLRGLRQPGTDIFTTAGASLAHLNQTYGRWNIRARFDKGVGLKMCALLWPAVGGQPPEIDFAESRTNDPERTVMTGTLHYPPVKNDLIQSKVDANFSEWHVWGVTWRPGIVSYTLDGKTWRVIRDDIEGTALGRPVVPTTPMHFGIQTTMGVPGAAKPDATTPDEVTLHIDWVRVWAYDLTT